LAFPNASTNSSATLESASVFATTGVDTGAELELLAFCELPEGSSKAFIHELGSDGVDTVDAAAGSSKLKWELGEASGLGVTLSTAGA
jgi:hypothetical protein